MCHDYGYTMSTRVQFDGCASAAHEIELELASSCRELAQLNQVAARKLEFVAMLKQEAATRERQVPFCNMLLGLHPTGSSGTDAHTLLHALVYGWVYAATVACMQATEEMNLLACCRWMT